MYVRYGLSKDFQDGVLEAISIQALGQVYIGGCVEFWWEWCFSNAKMN